MEGVRTYLLSVTAAGVFCAIIKSIGSMTGSGEGFLKILCGLFLMFTLISPLRRVELGELAEIFPDMVIEAERAVEEGKDYGFQARAAIIKSRSEAYILDKAADYGSRLNVEVMVSDTEPQIPEGVRITGDLSAYARKQLSEMIETELGIPKEAQQWSPWENE